MTKTLDPPKRRQGQCLSCYWFGFTFDFSGPRKGTCFHPKKNNTEPSEFCYDWKDIEDTNLE